MLTNVHIGMRVTINWGHCKGKTGVIIGFSATQRNIVIVEYIARAQDRTNGALPGEEVRVYIHKRHISEPTKPLGLV